jgi:hypothetical protein
MSPLHRPLRPLFLPATSARRTSAKAISALHADARKPSLLRELRPWRATRGTRIFRASLVQTSAALRPLHSADRSVPRVGTPPLALAAPAGVGQGQGVFVSKHSTAIQKRRNHTMTYTATYSPEDNKLRLYSSTAPPASTASYTTA